MSKETVFAESDLHSSTAGISLYITRACPLHSYPAGNLEPGLDVKEDVGVTVHALRLFVPHVVASEHQLAKYNRKMFRPRKGYEKLLIRNCQNIKQTEPQQGSFRHSSQC